MSTFTKQQIKLFAEAASSDNHIVCESVPGGAKTFSSIKSLEERSHTKKDTSTSLVLAFSNVIKDEFIRKTREKKLNVNVSTCHGLGNQAVRKKYPGVELNADKSDNIIYTIDGLYWYDRRQNKQLTEEGYFVKQIQEKLRLYNLEPTEDNIHWVANRFSMLLQKSNEQLVLKTVPDVVQRMAENTREIDYADMLWFPVIKNLTLPGYSFVVVDEYQDFSPLMQEILRKLAMDAQVMVVGDPHQSIFGFAGADGNACKNTQAMLKTTSRKLRRRDLTVTFRCPTSVVNLAKMIVPEIQAAPNAIDGLVKTIESGKVVEHIREVMQAGDLVIARRNVELLKLSLQLLTAKVPFMLRGKAEDAQPLIRYIQNLSKSAVDVNQLAYASERYMYKMKSLYESDDITEASFKQIKDNHEAVLALSQGDFDNPREIVSWLYQIYVDDKATKDKVILTTGHKAKGLECNNSLILRPDLFPMVFPCKKCKGETTFDGTVCLYCFGTGVSQQPWEIEQEKWLTYVAITRSKKTLTFVDCLPSLCTVTTEESKNE